MHSDPSLQFARNSVWLLANEVPAEIREHTAITKYITRRVITRHECGIVEIARLFLTIQAGHSLCCAIIRSICGRVFEVMSLSQSIREE